MPGDSWQESADSPCAVGQPRRVWLARANFMVLHPRKTRLSARIVLSTAAVLDCEMQFVRLNSHKKEERERRVYLGKEQGISIHRTRRDRIKESGWDLHIFLSPFHTKNAVRLSSQMHNVCKERGRDEGGEEDIIMPLHFEMKGLVTHVSKYLLVVGKRDEKLFCSS